MGTLQPTGQRKKNNAFGERQSAPTGGEGNDDGSLPLGQISVRANVSVTFDLLVPEEKPRNRDAK